MYTDTNKKALKLNTHINVLKKKLNDFYLSL